MSPSKLSKELQGFFAYIRQRSCTVCGSGDWDMDIGEYCNTVSHLIPKGSANRDNHFDNVVPMCVKCHRIYEDTPRSKRVNYIDDAVHLTKCWRLRSEKNIP